MSKGIRLASSGKGIRMRVAGKGVRLAPVVGGTPPGPPPAVVGAFTPASFAKPVIGSGVAGVTYAPAVRQPSAAGDLVGFNFNAGERGSLIAKEGGFGQVFAPGRAQPTSGLAVNYGGADYPVQMVPLATYAAGEPADPAHVGSVKHALLLMTYPALAAGATTQAMLKDGAAPTGAAVTIAAGDLAGFAGTFAVTGTYIRAGTTPTAASISVDISPAAMLALATPQTRFAGPRATEVRCIRTIPNTALRVILDIRRFANGELILDWQFRADNVSRADFNTIRSYAVTATLTQGGASVLNESVRLFDGQIFTKVVRSSVGASVNALVDANEHNIQIDAPEWSRIGAVPTYDYSTGVADSLIAAELSSINGSATWAKPLSNNFIQKLMQQVGGRPDLGMLPGWSGAYLQSGSEVLRRVVMAQGESAGAVPCHFVYAATSVPINPFPTIGTPGIWQWFTRPDLWPPNTVFDGDDNGWGFELAHQPSLAHLPYLLTGRRYFGDLVDSWAAAVVCGTNIDARDGTQNGYTGPSWLIVPNDQCRAAGWALRDVCYAAGWTPDTSVLRPKWRELLIENFEWCSLQRPVWTAIQGECYGWEAGFFYESENSPWAQDHFNAGVAAAVRLNVPGAREHFEWLSNFRVNIGVQPDNVFFWKGATSYRMFIPKNGDGNTPQTDIKTWTAMSPVCVQASASDGLPAQRPSQQIVWSGDNYGILWHRSVCEHRTLTNTAASATLLARFPTDLPPVMVPATKRGSLQLLADNFAPLVRV